MKRQVTRICKFEFCSVSMDTFAAVSAPYFISIEGCDCIKQNQRICHSIVGMSSTVHLPVAIRVLCSVKFFYKFISAPWQFSFSYDLIRCCRRRFLAS